MPISILIEQLVNGVVLGSIYALFAIGFSFSLGVMDIPNMAHGSLYMFASFLFFTMNILAGFPVLVSIAIAIAATAALGMLIEKLLISRFYDLPPFTFMFSVIVITIALDIAIKHAVGTVFGYWPRYIDIPYLSGNFISIGESDISYLKIVIIFVGVVLIWSLHLFITRTKVGNAVRAIVQDREAASLMGINVRALFTICFTISSGLAAVAGVLGGPLYSLNPEMGSGVLMKSFVIVIVAGFGNIQGTLIVALALGLWENISVNFLPSEFVYASEFVLLILILLFKGLRKRYGFMKYSFSIIA